ncbi:MAG: DUF1559 domain-containing protein [Thermoguttaceae bacterium]|nr:DUF1559 domain-containing protein [Thermoguttaceae bacterium]
MLAAPFGTPHVIFAIGLHFIGDGPGRLPPSQGAGRSARSSPADQPPPPPPPPPPPAPEVGSDGQTDVPKVVRPSASSGSLTAGSAVPSSNPLPEGGTFEEQSRARMERIAKAMLMYHQHHRRFPSAIHYDSHQQPQWSWRVELLPHLGFHSLHREFRRDEPWDSDHNRAVAQQIPDVYQTPGGAGENTTCYLVPTGRGTIFGRRDGMPASDITDGASNTILLVEADAHRAVPWTQPQDLPVSPTGPEAGLGTMLGGRFLAAMADGTLHAIPIGNDAASLYALFTPNANDTINPAMLRSHPAHDPLRNARQLLAAGRAAEARAKLEAAAIVLSNEEVLASLRWCEALKSPALMIRFGMVVQAKLPPAEPGRAQQHPQLQFWHTVVGYPLVVELETRFARGDFGVWYVDAIRDGPPATTAPPAARRPARGAAGRAGVATAPPPIAAGGLVNVGLLHEDMVLTTAEKMGLDFLIVAHVAVSRAAAGQKDADSNLVVRILDVAGRTKIYESDMLNSGRVVGSMRVGGTVADPAGDAIGQILQFIDEKIVLTDMPAILPVVAERRTETLAAQSYENPLSSLLEIRYYQWKGLLSAERLTECYTRILGFEAGPAVARGENSVGGRPVLKLP